jgi:hypothetical protein
VSAEPQPDVLVDRLDGSNTILHVRVWHRSTLAAEAAARDGVLRAILGELANVGVGATDPVLVVRAPDDDGLRVAATITQTVAG